MFEQAFRNIDDVLWKEAGCTTELDYTEQTSWLLFLKYLDGLEQDKAAEAALAGKAYTFILDEPYRWQQWAAPKDASGALPAFFENEDELRAIWGAPDTRKKLLEGLAEQGFGLEQLAEMQRIIEAEDSDLFDVLAHVAYARAPLTREVRAAQARVYINSTFDAKQQAFLDFVLQHYVAAGVEELDPDKLGPLLRLKYHDSISDAVSDLGEPASIGAAFSGFQRYLYVEG